MRLDPELSRRRPESAAVWTLRNVAAPEGNIVQVFSDDAGGIYAATVTTPGGKWMHVSLDGSFGLDELGELLSGIS